MSTLDHAKALIACASVTPDEAGCYAYLETVLQDMGFVTQRCDFGSVKNLYATRGNQGPHCMFAGHVDVVPAGAESAWSVPPFQPSIQDNHLWGRGAVDMKGAIAAFLGAMEPTPCNRTISVLLTSDEEGTAQDGTRKLVPWMKENNICPDVVILGEPTGTKVGEEIKIGRRGSVTATLEIQGSQGHIAYPENFQDPLHPLLRCLHQLTEHTLDEGNEYFQPSRLQVTSLDVGNLVTNITAHRAKAMWGVRFNPLHTCQSLMAWMHKVCAETLGHLPYTLDMQPHGPAYLTQDHRWIERIVQSVKEGCASIPKLSTTGGATDGRFLIDCAPVIECGLPETTMHQGNERVHLDDLRRLENIYRQIFFFS